MPTCLKHSAWTSKTVRNAQIDQDFWLYFQYHVLRDDFIRTGAHWPTATVVWLKLHGALEALQSPRSTRPHRGVQASVVIVFLV